MNKTSLFAVATIITACAGPNASIKKPAVEAEAEAKAEQTYAELAATYHRIITTCAEEREKLAHVRMEKIDSCMCESEKSPYGECVKTELEKTGEGKCGDIKDADYYAQCAMEIEDKANQLCVSYENESPREKCFRARGIPLQDEDYDPVGDEIIFEEDCHTQSATKLGLNFEELKTANKITSAKNLADKRNLFLSKTSFSKQEAREYIDLLRQMQRERMFADKDVGQILGTNNINQIVEYSIEDVSDAFRNEGYDKEADSLEGCVSILKHYYNAPMDFRSGITEGAIRAGLLYAPPSPECKNEEDKR